MQDPPHAPLGRGVLRAPWAIEERGAGAHQHQTGVFLFRRRRGAVLLHEVVQAELDRVERADHVDADGRQGGLLGGVGLEGEDVVFDGDAGVGHDVVDLARRGEGGGGSEEAELGVPIGHVAFDELGAGMLSIAAWACMNAAWCRSPWELLSERLSVISVEVAEDDGHTVNLLEGWLLRAKGVGNELRSVECTHVCLADAVRASSHHGGLAGQDTGVGVDGAVDRFRSVSHIDSIKRGGVLSTICSTYWQLCSLYIRLRVATRVGPLETADVHERGRATAARG